MCETSEDIVKNWRAIQNIVSVKHQPAGNLAAWNVYLAFVTVEQVPLWDKYEIENNKFKNNAKMGLGINSYLQNLMQILMGK